MRARPLEWGRHWFLVLGLGALRTHYRDVALAEYSYPRRKHVALAGLGAECPYLRHVPRCFTHDRAATSLMCGDLQCGFC